MSASHPLFIATFEVVIKGGDARVFGRYAFLCLSANGIEITDVLRDLSLVSSFAVNQGEPDRRVIDILQADQIGGFAAPVIIEYEIEFTLELIVCPVLNRRLIPVPVHRLLVERYPVPAPAFSFVGM